MWTGQAPRSTKVCIGHIHVCTQEKCFISEYEKYINEIVASEQQTKGELWCLGRFVKFSVVWVTMYMYQVLHPDVCIYIYIADSICTPDRRQSKTPPPPTNTDQKAPETDHSIVICRPAGAKWPQKNVQANPNTCPPAVKKSCDCHLSGVI